MQEALRKTKSWLSLHQKSQLVLRKVPLWDVIIMQKCRLRWWTHQLTGTGAYQAWVAVPACARNGSVQAASTEGGSCAMAAKLKSIVMMLHSSALGELFMV